MKQKKQAARASWVGYYPRRTKTKREKEIAARNKHKKRLYDRDAYLFTHGRNLTKRRIFGIMIKKNFYKFCKRLHNLKI